MAHRSWLALALVGMALIYETTAITCIKCQDKDNDLSCSVGAGKAPTACINPTDVCYMRNNGSMIERGCKEELPAADQLNCTPEQGKPCVTCLTDGCNNATWTKCHTCDESVNTCVDVQNQAGAVVCRNYVNDEQCYAKVDGEKVTRGCRSDLPITGNTCTGNKYCDLCTGDGCNSLSGSDLKAFPKCLSCKSTDAKCINATTPAVECDKRDDVCFTRLQEAVLERGCLSTLATAEQTKCKDEKDASCLTCTGTEGCNQQNWLMCHQCKQTDAVSCAEVQTDEKAQFCKTYKAENHCYMRLEGGNITRGCESDLTTDACKDNLECRRCAANGCNQEASSTLLNTDRCVQCSTVDDSDGSCLLGNAASQPCAKASEKKCFARVNAAGVLTRGCKGDLTAEEVSACTGKSCEICEADKCTKIFPADRLRCYQCNSGSEKSCSNQLTGESMSKYCKVYASGDQCYARISKGVFERGCQSDLKAAACEGLGPKECTTCKTENCNQISEERLKSSAGQKAVSSLLIAAVVAFLMFK